MKNHTTDYYRAITAALAEYNRATARAKSRKSKAAARAEYNRACAQAFEIAFSTSDNPHAAAALAEYLTAL